MADEEVLKYATPQTSQDSLAEIPTETVPDDARLFMRVHDQHIDKAGKLRPGVFRDQGAGMSTDWSKYSSAEDSRSRARKPFENGVISIAAGDTRRVRGLTVEHTPYNAEPPHARHVDVCGEKDEEVRMRLLELAGWEIKNRLAK